MIFSGDFEVLGATKLISQGEKDWQSNRQFVRFPVFAHHIEGAMSCCVQHVLAKAELKLQQSILGYLFSYLEF